MILPAYQQTDLGSPSASVILSDLTKNEFHDSSLSISSTIVVHFGEERTVSNTDEDVPHEVGFLSALFSRIPATIPKIFQNKKWFYIAYDTKFTECAINRILENLHVQRNSWKTMVAAISKASGLWELAERYPICPAHMAFITNCNGSSFKNCTQCGRVPPEGSDVGDEIVAEDTDYTYIPVLPSISSMVRDPAQYQALYKYRSSW